MRDLRVSLEKGLLGVGFKRTVPAGILGGHNDLLLGRHPVLPCHIVYTNCNRLRRSIGSALRKRASPAGVCLRGRVHGVETWILKLGLGLKQYISGEMDVDSELQVPSIKDLLTSQGRVAGMFSGTELE